MPLGVTSSKPKASACYISACTATAPAAIPKSMPRVDVPYSLSADSCAVRSWTNMEQDSSFGYQSPPLPKKTLAHGNRQTSTLGGQPTSPTYKSPTQCRPGELGLIQRPQPKPFPQSSPEPILQPIGSADLSPQAFCADKESCISNGVSDNKLSSVVVELAEDIGSSHSLDPQGRLSIVVKLRAIQKMTREELKDRKWELISGLINVIKKRGDDTTISFNCLDTLLHIILKGQFRSFKNRHGRDITGALVNTILHNLWKHRLDPYIIRKGIELLPYLPLTERNDTALYNIIQIHESLENQGEHLAKSRELLSPFLDNLRSLTPYPGPL
ncbi:hypothetical protein Pelo_8163 [Pelomyxa schiedti]|nr:hypothetical protein Pelo_8163 [Pelomyxa schiedti]